MLVVAPHEFVVRAGGRAAEIVCRLTICRPSSGVYDCRVAPSVVFRVTVGKGLCAHFAMVHGWRVHPCKRGSRHVPLYYEGPEVEVAPVSVLEEDKSISGPLDGGHFGISRVGAPVAAVWFSAHILAL